MWLYVVCIILVLFLQASAFRPMARQAMTRPSTSLYATEDDGYGPLGTLSRQGPVPFFIRLAKPDTYEAAVSKYMALEKCSRTIAMANMDAYFQDPNGWAGNQIRERKPGFAGKKLDYVKFNQDPSAQILTAVWSIGILGLFYRIFEVQVLSK